MLKIGDFSKLSRISIRMLRHYDEIGLMEPRVVDPATGYRYYGEDQLSVAGQIQSLKSMGFGLTVIREILNCCGGPEEMEKFLRVKKKELEDQLGDIGTKLQLLDNTIEWIRKDGNMMDYQVTLKTLPERYVASVRKVIPAYDQEHILWGILHGEPGHLQTYMAVCYTVVLFVRRLSRRHVPDLVQTVFVIGLFSEEKVTVMDRVECTAHDSDFPHIQ